MVLNKQQFILALLILSIQQGIGASENYKSFIREHPFISGGIGVVATLFAFKKYNDHRINKKLDQIEEKINNRINNFDQNIEKNNKLIKTIKADTAKSSVESKNIITSSNKLKNQYDQLAKNQENITTLFQQQTDNILNDLEENRKAIDNIQEITNEVGDLINQHVQNTNEMKDQFEDIEEKLNEIGINTQPDPYLVQLKLDQQELKEALNMLKTLNNQ